MTFWRSGFDAGGDCRRLWSPYCAKTRPTSRIPSVCREDQKKRKGQDRSIHGSAS